MKPLELLERQNKMLTYLSSLPRRMLALHGIDNVTEFVLHDLCHEQCFNFSKAAYFVDNPDFDCTKGVAGYSRSEAFSHPDVWQNQKLFTKHMQDSAFNQQVRKLARCSLKKGKEAHEDLAHMLAQDLAFKNYAFCSWPMRHDNEGFVLYEKSEALTDLNHEQVLNGLSLLSFCPIF